MFVVQLVILNLIHDCNRHILIVDPLVDPLLARTRRVINMYLILSSSNSYQVKED